MMITVIFKQWTTMQQKKNPKQTKRTPYFLGKRSHIERIYTTWFNLCKVPKQAKIFYSVWNQDGGTSRAKKEKANGCLESWKWCFLLWVVVTQICPFCDNQAAHVRFVHFSIFVFSMFRFQLKVITKNKSIYKHECLSHISTNSQLDTLL